MELTMRKKGRYPADQINTSVQLKGVPMVSMHSKEQQTTGANDHDSHSHHNVNNVKLIHPKKREEVVMAFDHLFAMLKSVR